MMIPGAMGFGIHSLWAHYLLPALAQVTEGQKEMCCEICMNKK